MRWGFSTACAALLLAALSLDGRASPEAAIDRSRRAFDEANVLYREGRYRQALARYDEAVQLLSSATAEARADFERLTVETTRREALGAKYIRVKQEYYDFKAHYGLVLEDDWITIADAITFERGDWLARTDDLLDRFRLAMARERADAASHIGALSR